MNANVVCRRSLGEFNAYEEDDLTHKVNCGQVTKPLFELLFNCFVCGEVYEVVYVKPQV